jgi:hypothetical protein
VIAATLGGPPDECGEIAGCAEIAGDGVVEDAGRREFGPLLAVFVPAAPSEREHVKWLKDEVAQRSSISSPLHRGRWRPRRYEEDHEFYGRLTI